MQSPKYQISWESVKHKEEEADGHDPTTYSHSMYFVWRTYEHEEWYLHTQDIQQKDGEKKLTGSGNRNIRYCELHTLAHF